MSVSIFSLRRLAASAIVIGSYLFLWLILRFPVPGIFLLLSFLWFGFVLLLDFLIVQSRRLGDLSALHGGIIIGSVGLLSIVEWSLAKLVIVVFSGLALGAVVWFSDLGADVIFYNEKPVRRLWMILWVFVVYSLFSTGFALPVFFTALPLSIVLFAASLGAALAAACIWRLYFQCRFETLWVWTLVILMTMMEITWMLSLLPFGYLTTGLLAVWVWYIMQLFVRFHLSTQDILWKKQRWFLWSNALAMILTLWQFIRWV